MSVSKLMIEMDAQEIGEWMAYDLCMSEEYSKKLLREKELEASRNMSKEERLSAFKALLSGKKD